MPNQTRIETGSTPSINELERLLNNQWYPDNRPQFDPATEGQKLSEQNRTGGFRSPQATGNYYTTPDQTPVPYSNTPVRTRPLNQVRTLQDFLNEQEAVRLAEQRAAQAAQVPTQPRVSRPYSPGVGPYRVAFQNQPGYVRPLNELKTIQDFVAEQRQASSPNTLPSRNYYYAGKPQGNSTGNYYTVAEPTPVPYTNRPGYVRPLNQVRTIQDFVDDQLRQGLTSRGARTGSAPSAPVPSPAPILNPRNLTRPLSRTPIANLPAAVRRAVAPAGRAVAPLASRLAPAGRAALGAYRTVAPAIPYIAAGLDFVDGLQSGESVGRAGAGALGSLGGGLYGAAQGAALGTAILPGLGTVIGGVAGGALGTFGGGWLGDRLYDTLFPNGSTPDLNQPISRGAAPPFYGGQEPGRRYYVSYSASGGVDVNGVPDPNVYESFVMVSGPVQGIQFMPDGKYYLLAYLDANYQPEPTYLGFYNPAFYPNPEARITNISRVDGQPDTWGNPAPLPGAPNQPSLAPITSPSSTLSPAIGTSTQSPQSPTNPANLSPATPTDPFTPQSPAPQTNPLAPGASPTPATNPAMAPTADPQKGNSPIWNPIGALPFLLPAIMPAALGSRGSYPQLWRPPSTTTSISTGGGTGTGSEPSNVCRFRTTEIDRNWGDIKESQVAIAALQELTLGKLQLMDNKLGPQVEGGLSGYLKKFWKWFHVDRILNLLTFWTTIHNAIMLSNNIGQTLFSGFDIVFELFGSSLKDDEGNNISTSEWVGGQIDTALKAIFGDQNVETVKAVWTRANRIYQAASNIVNALQSMIYSVIEGLEAIGKYVALIGNAAKRFGVVAERAYGWMNVNPNFRTNKFFKVLDGVQEAAETFETVAGEVQNIAQLKDEIQTQRTELGQLLSQGEDEKKTLEDDSKKSSIYPQAALIRDSDLISPGEE